MRGGVLGAAAAGIALACAAATAQAAPAVERGWPVRAPAGEVLPGPTGGPAVLYSVSVNNEEGTALRAYGLRGKRLWEAFRAWGCGNCDGPADTRLQPDDTYGPVGFTGDDPWAVDRRGRIIEACTGVVSEDGACTAAASSLEFPGAVFIPQLTRTRNGSVVWQHRETDMNWVEESGAPPVVADRRGLSYVGFGFQSTLPEQSQRLVIIGTDGALARRIPDGGEPVGALRSGVVTRNGGMIARFLANGSRRWTRDVPFSHRVTTDPVRGRVYIHDGRLLEARAGASGRLLWRTSAHRLASIGPTGRVYVIDRRGGRHGVRALRWDGRLLWRHRTPRPVAGVAELAGRRAGISTTGNRLVVVNPARRR